MKLNKLALVALFTATTFATTTAALADGVVNIYSYRQPDLVKPVLDAFTAETGIETRILNLTDGLLERLQAEGRNSPADVIFTTDIARLTELKSGDVTQPVASEAIAANIPAQYRDPENHWFGLTMRSRVVYASLDRVSETSITYEDLADEKWRGRLCTRSGQHPYNIALFASMIAHHGEEYTKTWLEGVKSNLARVPAGNDRAQAQSIFSGECDIAIGNTYYVGLMVTNDENPEQKDWAASMRVLFPNVDDRGSHVNLSGMAMAQNAPNAENALKLMTFLSSASAQEIYAEQVFEYPLIEGGEVSDVVASFGDLTPDTLSLDDVANNRALASQLVDEVGFDN